MSRRVSAERRPILEPNSFGPCWVRAATIECGRRRSPAVSDGSEEPQVAGPPVCATGMMRVGDSDCGPEGQRSAPSGSRRAATSVRNNRRVCSETVEDHDRRFWHRWPLTWRSSHAFTVLNTTQFHVRRLGTDLARRKPGVQIPSPPPPAQTSTRRGCLGFRGRRRSDENALLCHRSSHECADLLGGLRVERIIAGWRGC
jgi:hypothetical protein